MSDEVETSEQPQASERGTATKWPGWLLLAAGALWLAAAPLNVSITPGATVPWTQASEYAIEWTAAGALFFCAGIASWRRNSLGAAIAVPTVVVMLAIVAYNFGPFTGKLLLPAGTVLAGAALVIAGTAAAWNVVCSRSARGLTRPGLLASLVAIVPATAWSIAYGPSWSVTNYSVVGGRFSATGTDHLSIAHGALVGSGSYNLVTGALLLFVPLPLVAWSGLFRSATERMWAVLATGLMILTDALDNLWGLGPTPRAQLRSWWGWAYHGQINTVATPWFWTTLAAGVALCATGLFLAAWARALSE